VVASSLLPGADSRENPNRQIDSSATILPQRCGQRARRIKSMSARSGQAGTVYRFRDNWIGQWLKDANVLDMAANWIAQSIAQNRWNAAKDATQCTN
jgi:hypothetical protein